MKTSFSTPFQLSNFTIRLLTYKSWNRYIRYVLCGKVHNGWDKVVLDDNTTDGPPIGCLLSKQQTNGFQSKFDCWRWVTHGTNLDKMLFLDRLYGCKGKKLSLNWRIFPYCDLIFLHNWIIFPTNLVMKFVLKLARMRWKKNTGTTKKTANCWKGIFDTLRNWKVSELNHDLSEKQNLQQISAQNSSTVSTHLNLFHHGLFVKLTHLGVLYSWFHLRQFIHHTGLLLFNLCSLFLSQNKCYELKLIHYTTKFL